MSLEYLPGAEHDQADHGQGDRADDERPDQRRIRFLTHVVSPAAPFPRPRLRKRRTLALPERSSSFGGPRADHGARLHVEKHAVGGDGENAGQLVRDHHDGRAQAVAQLQDQVVEQLAS